MIADLSADDIIDRLDELAALLHACVHAGANINFIMPFSTNASSAFWVERVLPGARSDTRVVLAAKIDGLIAGSVQLDTETPPNQPHRGEVTKLMVHPSHRRKGVARALMIALESRARALGRTLLTLDTRTGDSAEPLYISLGYQTAGIIPDFCLDPFEDRLHPTTLMYKPL